MENLTSKLKKTISRLFSAGAFHVIISSTINKMIGFLSGIILVRLVSKDVYGVYTYAFSVFNIFALMNGLGMPSALLQVRAERQKDEHFTKSITSFATRYGSIFSLVLSAIIVIAALTIKFNIEGTNQLLLIFALLPLPMYILEIGRVGFRSSLENKRFALSNTIEVVLVFVLSVAGALLFKALGLTFGRVLGVIISVVLVIKFLDCEIIFEKYELLKEEVIDFIKLSSISMINIGLSTLLSQISILIMGSVIGQSTTIASYSVAAKIPDALFFIPASIIIFIYPYFAMNKDNRSWTKKRYYQLTGVMFAIVLPITIIGILLAPWVMKIFGNEYQDAVSPFRILMVSFLIQTIFRVIPGNLLVTQRRLKFNLLVSIVATVISILFNILLIIPYGSIGAAYSQLATMSITGLINTLYYNYVISTIEE